MVGWGKWSLSPRIVPVTHPDGLPGAFTLVAGSATAAALIATPSIPLNVRMQRDAVILSWPNDGLPWTLESRASLAPPGPWERVTTAPKAHSGEISVTLPVTAPTDFFRLVR